MPRQAKEDVLVSKGGNLNRSNSISLSWLYGIGSGLERFRAFILFHSTMPPVLLAAHTRSLLIRTPKKRSPFCGNLHGQADFQPDNFVLSALGQ